MVAIYVGFIGFKMGANGGRAQMGVDTIIMNVAERRGEPRGEKISMLGGEKWSEI